jgi:hypothetical protein
MAGGDTRATEPDHFCAHRHHGALNRHVAAFSPHQNAAVKLNASATMSELGQTRKSSLRANVFRCSPSNGHDATIPVCRLSADMLQKSFWGAGQIFPGPLMRFARGDMRDHIASHKNDYGPSYRRYGVLQRRSRLKISFCEIFGVSRFSTFATISAKRRHSLYKKSCHSLTLSKQKAARTRRYSLSSWNVTA